MHPKGIDPFSILAPADESFIHRPMSIDVIKQELAGLPAAERSQIMAYLLALQDGQDDAYRSILARKIDEKDPRRWVTLEELDRRLSTLKE